MGLVLAMCSESLRPVACGVPGRAWGRRGMVAAAAGGVKRRVQDKKGADSDAWGELSIVIRRSRLKAYWYAQVNTGKEDATRHRRGRSHVSYWFLGDRSV